MSTLITVHPDETECDAPLSPHPGDQMDSTCAHGLTVREVWA